MDGGMRALAADFLRRNDDIPVRPPRPKKFRKAFEDAPPPAPPSSHSLEDVEPSRDEPGTVVPVPHPMVRDLMTMHHRRILMDQTGADIEWCPRECQVVCRGTLEKVRAATRILARVTTHCQWGINEAKVERILKPRQIESIVCRLSPMARLGPAEKKLTALSSTLSVGKDGSNDTVVRDPMISRVHCVLELDTERGGVYVQDHSTNGTFLNGVRLCKASMGKVLISHGDELLLKDPAGGEEFGYIVNLQDVFIRPEPERGTIRRSVGQDHFFGAAMPPVNIKPAQKAWEEAPRPGEKREEDKTNLITGARLAAQVGPVEVEVDAIEDEISADMMRYRKRASSSACRHHLTGICRMGAKCRFVHVTADPTAAPIETVNVRKVCTVIMRSLAAVKESGDAEGITRAFEDP